MTDKEEESITNWVRMHADAYLSDVKPARVDDAELSKAVRFRWFDVRIADESYLVGVNIHYGGNFGAVWIKNQRTKETLEFHPNMTPSHGLSPETRNSLRETLKDVDAHIEKESPDLPQDDESVLQRKNERAKVKWDWKPLYEKLF